MNEIGKTEFENPVMTTFETPIMSNKDMTFETPIMSNKDMTFETPIMSNKDMTFETPIMSNKDMTFEDDLDISWFDSYEKEARIDENLHREPIKDIMLYFVYINKRSEIHKVISEKYVFDINGLENQNDGIQTISNSQVLQWIQTKKVLPSHSNTKYKIIDLLMYSVDIEPEKIQSYSNADIELLNELSSGFFKVLSLFHNISIPPSIFIFHPLNSIYFLFKEQDPDIKAAAKKEFKSILKSSSKTKKRTSDMVGGELNEEELVLKKTYTKKVRFS